MKLAHPHPIYLGLDQGRTRGQQIPDRGLVEERTLCDPTSLRMIFNGGDMAKEIVLCSDEEPKPTRPKLKPICFRDIEPEPVHWLWRPYIPKGMITIIEGDPGLGKSWLTLSLASLLSQGRPMPGSKLALPPQKVLIMNSEDSPQHTIRPRLDALGANVDLIFQAPRHFPLDKEGILEMEGYLHDVAAGVVFIDPIVGWIGSKVDMHRANEVREIMGALDKIARNTGASIIVVRHLRKGGAGGKAIYGGIGSIDFTAAARSVLLVERTPENAHVVRHIKCNVAPLGPTLEYAYNEYEVTDKFGNAVTSSRFEWLGQYEGPDLDRPWEEMVEGPLQPRKRDIVDNWLREFLKDGPRLVRDCQAEAKKMGFADRTLKRAKDQGGAESVKIGDFYYWQLPVTRAEAELREKIAQRRGAGAEAVLPPQGSEPETAPAGAPG